MQQDFEKCMQVDNHSELEVQHNFRAWQICLLECIASTSSPQLALHRGAGDAGSCELLGEQLSGSEAGAEGKVPEAFLAR